MMWPAICVRHYLSMNAAWEREKGGKVGRCRLTLTIPR